MDPVASATVEAIRRRLAKHDPVLLEAAVDAQDDPLFRHLRSMSPFERLDWCTAAGRAVTGWKRVPPQTG